MTDYDPLELLTVEQLSAKLGVRRTWIYDKAQSGELPSLKLGRMLRFQRGQVAAYLDAQQRRAD